MQSEPQVRCIGIVLRLAAMVERKVSPKRNGARGVASGETTLAARAMTSMTNYYVVGRKTKSRRTVRSAMPDQRLTN